MKTLQSTSWPRPIQGKTSSTHPGTTMSVLFSNAIHSGRETTKESPASQSSQLSDAASELPKATKGDISAERAERIERIERFNSLQKRQVAVTGKVNSTLERREKLKKAIARLELKEHELAQQQLQISSKKRQLLQSMSVDDQLEFVYEAGRTAESKRLRNGQ
jgi:hypothetical protein